MIFRTKEDFIKRIQKEINKLSEDEHIVISNSPHLIKKIILDEPNIIKKQLIIEWDIVDLSENEEEENADSN